MKMKRTHAALAVVLGILIPVASRVFGAGELSFAMYAHAHEYRLDVLARTKKTSDDEPPQRPHRIAPTELARGVRPSVVPLLAGADHFRVTPRIEELRATLPQLASHACDVERETTGAIEIEVILEDRAREDAPIRRTSVVATCAP